MSCFARLGPKGDTSAVAVAVEVTAAMTAGAMDGFSARDAEVAQLNREAEVL
ncbi:hypothetical protein ITJ55_13875 [Frigoribacterium sp. VKM Ac-1396]|uniref:hypothetical protein n=1 Tax=Frigoribacterium sp. VKM Ac-1396 TaxID=2783821 RepID=UPI00188C7E8E|nr:hypothetical protein [Frigoribacterium sp. VKM Ac-1396]MBF4601900.1 hypothetical protein [Frigoribacterium sp. VKM Ac-1396]